jgi:hypothetical protein
MPQMFHRSANTIARLTILGAVLLVSLTNWVLASVSRSDDLTDADVGPEPSQGVLSFRAIRVVRPLSLTIA